LCFALGEEGGGGEGQWRLLYLGTAVPWHSCTLAQLYLGTAEGQIGEAADCVGMVGMADVLLGLPVFVRHYRERQALPHPKLPPHLGSALSLSPMKR
jgi:hypothetical protein